MTDADPVVPTLEQLMADEISVALFLCVDTVIGPLLSSLLKYKRKTLTSEFMYAASYSLGGAGSRGATTPLLDITPSFRLDADQSAYCPSAIEHQ